MAKKLTSLDKDIQTAQKKLEQLKKERKQLEEAMFIKIGKLYFEKEKKRRPDLTHEILISELKEKTETGKTEGTSHPNNSSDYSHSNQ